MSMAEEFKKLSIQNVAGGAAAELFDHSIQEVLENILDDNREPEQTRTITLVFKIDPNRERNSASISVQAKNGLAPVIAADGLMFYRREGARKIGVFQHDMKQPELPFGNVSPIANKEPANV